MMRTTTSRLGALLPPSAAEEFRQIYWPNRCYFNNESSVYEFILADIPEIMDVDKLVPHRIPSVRVHRRVASSYRPVHVPSEEFKQTDFSCTWSIERAQDFCPSIKCLVYELAAYLCLSPDRISATIFVSVGATGLPWHFDPVEVLVVPLIGEKVWFLKENDIVRFPFHKFIPSSESVPHPELAMHCSRELQTPLRHDLIWKCRPGSICFLPRGCWHKTEGRERSVSLSIALNTPRAMDVLLARLQPLLGTSEQWREPFSQTRGTELAVALAAVVAALKLPTTDR